MRLVSALLAIVVLAGCASRRYSSYYDPYEAAQIEQVSGNTVSGRVFQRTLVCLNARRETRQLHAVTNVTVAWTTNVTVVPQTNLTVSVTTNQSRTLATNLLALPPPSPPSTNEAAGAEAPAVVVTAAPPNSTNVSVTTSQNAVSAQAGNQLSSVLGAQTQISRQVTVSASNATYTTAENLLLAAETNRVVVFQTNTAVVPITNVVVIATNLLLRDYYLVVELTPPPDFTPAPGENLVLVLDGVRHTLAPGAGLGSWKARKGFQTTVYRVQPELLVDLANAREARLRLRGVTSVVDRRLSHASRQAIRKFLLKYFNAEPAADQPTAEPEAHVASHHPES